MKYQTERLIQYTYLKLGLYALAFLIVIIFFTVLSLNSDYEYLLEVIRLDKYEIHGGAFRYILSIAGAILSGSLVIKFGIGRRFILIPSVVFFILLTVLVYPGIIMTASDDPQGNLAVYGYIVSLILFSLGVVTASTLLQYQPTKEIDLHYSQFGTSPVIDSLARKWVIIIAITGIFLLAFGSGLNESGVLDSIISFFKSGMISDSSKKVLAFRMVIYELSQSVFTVGLGYLNRLVMPIVATSLILYGSMMNKRLLKWAGFVLAVFVCIMLFGTGSRLTVGQIIIYFLIVFTLIRPIHVKNLIWIASASMVLLTLMTLAMGRFSGGEGYIVNAVMAVNRVLERAFLSKGSATLIVFEYFPHVEPYQFGKTIITQLAGRISETPTLAQKMMMYKYGSLGTAGPQSFGDAYANFGIWGMILYSYIIGLVLQVISIYIVRKKKMEPHTIAIMGYFTFLCAYSGYSGIASFKTNGLHVLLFYVVVSKVIIEIIRGSVGKKESNRRLAVSPKNLETSVTP